MHLILIVLQLMKTVINPNTPSYYVDVPVHGFPMGNILRLEHLYVSAIRIDEIFRGFSRGKTDENFSIDLRFQRGEIVSLTFNTEDASFMAFLNKMAQLNRTLFR
ncbi:MAG: hypothetical protein SP1CHLAM54_11470 [Chlamydiia bacterium]|nr:hypothetical protein [Chlamydiia bacterium]MCH9616050.1 hypothetical protein [Chlamydiia bacterium]MCH9629073.1 hypothetical protein [Chlamydiia bacterium]